MNRKLSLVLIMALGLSLSACGGKKDTGALDNNDNNDNNDINIVEDSSESNAWGTGYSVQELSSRFGINGNPLNYKTVYFEYNSTVIDERSNIIASAHARNLSGQAVSLLGHADERGTRDYNLALGERRSQAVANLMSAVGTSGSSLQTISYGEERPANPAHNESAWQQNRRVEISY